MVRQAVWMELTASMVSYNHSVGKYICKDRETDYKADVDFGAEDGIPMHGRDGLMMGCVVQSVVVYRGLVQ